MGIHHIVVGAAIEGTYLVVLMFLPFHKRQKDEIRNEQHLSMHRDRRSYTLKRSLKTK